MIFLATFIHVPGIDHVFTNTEVKPISPTLGLIASFTLYIYYIGYIVFSVKFGLKIRPSGLCISLGYLILLIFSLGYGEDVVRYSMLFLLALTFTNSKTYLEIGGLEKYLRCNQYAGILFFIVSAIFDGLYASPGVRLSGYTSNPNIFGALLLYFLCINLTLYDLDGVKNKILDVAISIAFGLYILLSGSRSAIAGCLLVAIYYTVRKNFIIGFIVILLIMSSFGFVLVNDTDNFNVLINRIESISESFEVSGRSDIIEVAFKYISQNWYLGNGMISQELYLGTGNVHNSYVRIIFMVGVAFGFISCGLIILGNVIAFLKSNIQSFAFKIFPLFVLGMSIGEDYLVGVGSCLMFYYFQNMKISANFRYGLKN